MKNQCRATNVPSPHRNISPNLDIGASVHSNLLSATAPHSVLELQRLAGNAAVSQLLGADHLGTKEDNQCTGRAQAAVSGVHLQRSVEQEGAPGKRPNLDVGDSGPGVSLLQWMVGATQTTVFDQQTRKAVDRFQRQQGWEPSGVGPMTWDAIDNHAGTPGRRPNLVEGDRGPGVRLLQRMLGVQESGFFGPATRKAWTPSSGPRAGSPAGSGR
jgi:murein L,D-transpeptidase YcbB/YkuD